MISLNVKVLIADWLERLVFVKWCILYWNPTHSFIMIPKFYINSPCKFTCFFPYGDIVWEIHHFLWFTTWLPWAPLWIFLYPWKAWEKPLSIVVYMVPLRSDAEVVAIGNHDSHCLPCGFHGLVKAGWFPSQGKFWYGTVVYCVVHCWLHP